MVDVIFAPPAEAEYDAARAWYLNRDPTAADALVAAVAKAVDLIRHFPTAFPLLDDEYRFTAVGRFPYTLVYRVADPVVVVAFPHDRRAPGYWHGRTDPAT